MLNAIRYERANFLHEEFQFGDMHAKIVDDFHFMLRSFLEFFIKWLSRWSIIVYTALRWLQQSSTNPILLSAAPLGCNENYISA